ncbi:hypothetical protein ACGFYA_35075 [Streptomyces sp. NPDC048305]|uniref:hypothetical protein n=1 Tax=Streptomyces sp. NPDC048305 TaxID=3365532 RepID=UPI00371CF273
MQQNVAPVTIRNALFGLVSRTNVSRGVTLSSLMNDAIAQAISGRSSISDFDSTVKQ